MSMATSVITKPSIPETEFGEVASVAQGSRPDYSLSDPLRAPSGFTDYSIQEMRVVSTWKTTLARTFETFGYTPIDTAPVENACNLQKTGGLDKQIYGVSRLQDGTLTKLGLPFDRTVPMARFIASHSNSMQFPYHRQDINWSWRGEHAQTGRYRAFIQADVDTVHHALDALSDAQCIVTIIKGLQKLGVPDFVLYLNHVSIAKEFLNLVEIDAKHHKDALRAIDKLKPDNEAEVVRELMENVPSFSADRAAALLKMMNYRGPISKFELPSGVSKAATDGFEHLKQIEKITGFMGVKDGTLEFCLNLTRGLDYYTGVVFETFMPGKERYGSIASGGRYDDLIGAFNPSVKLQGVGGSIGLTRLFDVMKAEKLVDLTKQTTAKVFIGYRTEAEQETAISLATALRDRGIETELNVVVPKVKKQLEMVNAKGIPFAILVMNKDEICLKDMGMKKDSAAQTQQETFRGVDEAVAAVSLKLKTPAPADECKR